MEYTAITSADPLLSFRTMSIQWLNKGPGFREFDVALEQGLAVLLVMFPEQANKGLVRN